MSTIHEFPQWLVHRSAQAQSGFEADIVIFPGVRIERDESADKRVPWEAAPVTSSSDGGRRTTR